MIDREKVAANEVSYRFWAKVRQGAPDECWEWQAHRNAAGYGRFLFEGVSRGAHRVAWALTHGHLPDGKFVCHRCDNPSCVNPTHLFLGTAQDNVDDMMAKGRHVRPTRDETRVSYVRGERSHLSKFTAEQVRAIRARAARGASKQSIANEYGVDRTAISQIVLRKVWKHV